MILLFKNNGRDQTIGVQHDSHYFFSSQSILRITPPISSPSFFLLKSRQSRPSRQKIVTTDGTDGKYGTTILGIQSLKQFDQRF